MSFNTSEILLWMAIILFIMGGLSFLAGTIILLIRTTNKDIRTLAVQTNRLAQKGIVDGVAGLVGNASTLLEATNQLVRTTTGIGVFLVFTSFLLIGISLLILIRTL
ncbi:hypothetical protein ACFLXI_02965 [Chloroflexota bacterium]